MVSSPKKAVIAITSPLEIVNAQRIASHDYERSRVLFRPDLLPPARYIADHTGPSDWTRTPAQQSDWEAMLQQADILWDLPYRDSKPLATLCPNLRWVQTTSAGVGPMVQKLGLADMDVIITTASGVHAGPLAEFAIGALLHQIKLFPQLRRWQEEHHWERYCAGELRGQTLVVVGPGRIGREVIRLAKAFGMNVIAVGTGARSTKAAEIGADDYVLRDGLIDAVAKADAIVLCCPHTPETTNLVSAEVIAAFKPGLTLVNIARGVVIDEDAMIGALQSGQIGFAALDVFREEPLPSGSPLWDLPNVLISPHSASTAYAENDRLVEIFLLNLTLFLDGDIEQMSPRLDPHRGY